MKSYSIKLLLLLLLLVTTTCFSQQEKLPFFNVTQAKLNAVVIQFSMMVKESRNKLNTLSYYQNNAITDNDSNLFFLKQPKYVTTNQENTVEVTIKAKGSKEQNSIYQSLKESLNLPLYEFVSFEKSPSFFDRDMSRYILKENKTEIELFIADEEFIILKFNYHD